MGDSWLCIRKDCCQKGCCDVIRSNEPIESILRAESVQSPLDLLQRLEKAEEFIVRELHRHSLCLSFLGGVVHSEFEQRQRLFEVGFVRVRQSDPLGPVHLDQLKEREKDFINRYFFDIATP